ncbi:hypothetical protein HK104_000531, partial [Borealophlyctis nickersoniae]
REEGVQVTVNDHTPSPSVPRTTSVRDHPYLPQHGYIPPPLLVKSMTVSRPARVAAHPPWLTPVVIPDGFVVRKRERVRKQGVDAAKIEEQKTATTKPAPMTVTPPPAPQPRPPVRSIRDHPAAPITTAPPSLSAKKVGKSATFVPPPWMTPLKHTVARRGGKMNVTAGTETRTLDTVAAPSTALSLPARLHVSRGLDMLRDVQMGLAVPVLPHTQVTLPVPHMSVSSRSLDLVMPRQIVTGVTVQARPLTLIALTPATPTMAVALTPFPRVAFDLTLPHQRVSDIVVPYTQPAAVAPRRETAQAVVMYSATAPPHLDVVPHVPAVVGSLVVRDVAETCLSVVVETRQGAVVVWNETVSPLLDAITPVTPLLLTPEALEAFASLTEPPAPLPPVPTAPHHAPSLDNLVSFPPHPRAPLPKFTPKWHKTYPVTRYTSPPPPVPRGIHVDVFGGLVVDRLKAQKTVKRKEEKKREREGYLFGVWPVVGVRQSVGPIPTVGVRERKTVVQERVVSTPMAVVPLQVPSQWTRTSTMVQLHPPPQMTTTSVSLPRPTSLIHTTPTSSALVTPPPRPSTSLASLASLPRPRPELTLRLAAPSQHHPHTSRWSKALNLHFGTTLFNFNLAFTPAGTPTISPSDPPSRPASEDTILLLGSKWAKRVTVKVGGKVYGVDVGVRVYDAM